MVFSTARRAGEDKHKGTGVPPFRFSKKKLEGWKRKPIKVSI